MIVTAYAAANRVKIRKQFYVYDAMHGHMQIEAGRIFGDQSASLFCFAAAEIVLEKLGHRYPTILTDDDNEIINKLKRHIQ